MREIKSIPSNGSNLLDNFSIIQNVFGTNSELGKPLQTLNDQQIETKLAEAIKNYWGYDSFRPRQLAAMMAVMQDQDSLAVFPTGAGKSLCFQAPAVCREGYGGRGFAVNLADERSSRRTQILRDQRCVSKQLTFGSRRK